MVVMVNVLKGIKLLAYLPQDIAFLINDKSWKIITHIFYLAALVVIRYRRARLLHLTLGRVGDIARVTLRPVILLIKPWLVFTEIHYKYNLGSGLHFSHPNLGVFFSKHAIIGCNCTLVGGNVIDGRRSGRLHTDGFIVLEDNVILGANATIPGPCTIGSDVLISANALVMNDCASNMVLFGVSARTIQKGIQKKEGHRL
jgi:serine acetyltransferase